MESFDVVTMIELIEHLADPMEDLRAVQNLLRPGGALFLTTPNAGSLRCRLFGFRETLGPPGHLWGFTLKALRKLLYRAGLRPVRVWTDGLNPYLLLRRIRSASGAWTPNVWTQTQRLREQAITNPLVRVLKFSVNVGMRLTRWGDTLKAIAVKPEP
jgi:SAM-dependent methyltransferase